MRESNEGIFTDQNCKRMEGYYYWRPRPSTGRGKSTGYLEGIYLQHMLIDQGGCRERGGWKACGMDNGAFCWDLPSAWRLVCKKCENTVLERKCWTIQCNIILIQNMIQKYKMCCAEQSITDVISFIWTWFFSFSLTSILFLFYYIRIREFIQVLYMKLDDI